jgi:hypothetical protein
MLFLINKPPASPGQPSIHPHYLNQIIFSCPAHPQNAGSCRSRIGACLRLHGSHPTLGLRFCRVRTKALPIPSSSHPADLFNAGPTSASADFLKKRVPSARRASVAFRARAQLHPQRRRIRRNLTISASSTTSSIGPKRSKRTSSKTPCAHGNNLLSGRCRDLARRKIWLNLRERHQRMRRHQLQQMVAQRSPRK